MRDLGFAREPLVQKVPVRVEVPLARAGDLLRMDSISENLGCQETA